MLRSEGGRRLIVFAGLCLAFGAVAAWLFWTRQLTPVEAALLGTWRTARQPDGSTTVIHIMPDRTCNVRWLDAAGRDMKTGPEVPRPGRWWVEHQTLFVDVTAEPEWFAFKKPENPAARAWSFAIQEESLVIGPETKTPVTLRRSGETVR